MLPAQSLNERHRMALTEVKMQVQVNHDNHLIIAQDTSDRLGREVETSLSKYAQQISRIEMHLGDVNGTKHGDSDKRCMLEARLDHLHPITATHQAPSVQLAIDGALKKLDHALSHAIGKLRAHKRGAPEEPS
jgi:ribosome-associated translation inhibitor RaiA